MRRLLLTAALAVALVAPTTSVLAGAAEPAASWDFNGDGMTDLADGWPGAEEGGPGAVFVRYRTSDGFTERQTLRHPGRVGDSNDGFGAAVASTDLDRDGYADLAVGAPGYRLDQSTYGSVTVFRGSPTGLSQSGTTTLAWPRPADGDQVAFGTSLAVADLSRDGWPDIAVGAVDGDGDRGADRSFVATLFGGPAGFALERANVVAAPAGTRWFGLTIAAGDVNGDGYVDLVESADGPGPHVSFAAGTADGPRQARVLTNVWAQSLAVGDVTRDGVADIVASRPYRRYDNARAKPYVGTGRVTLFRGSASGPRDGVTVTQESPGVPGRSTYRDFFGSSVTILDVNANGTPEVVVGAPGETVDGVRAAGALTLLRVGPSGFRTNGNRRVTQDQRGIPGRPQRFGFFGDRVSGWDGGERGRLFVTVRRPSAPRSDPGVLGIMWVVDGRLGTGPARSYAVLDGTGLLPRESGST